MAMRASSQWTRLTARNSIAHISSTTTHLILRCCTYFYISRSPTDLYDQICRSAKWTYNWRHFPSATWSLCPAWSWCLSPTIPSSPSTTSRTAHSTTRYRVFILHRNQRNIYCTFYTGSPSSGLKMQIVFKRRLTNELLTTYLPSLILILMCYATSFFRPIYFEAAVTVNLSILLVTTTLFIRFTQLFQSFPYIELWYSVWWQNCQLLPMFEWLIFGSYSYNFTHLLRQSHT